jgi:hypothetical protein
MSTLLVIPDALDHRSAPPATPERSEPDDQAGFVDCRGVLHRWDEKED